MARTPKIFRQGRRYRHLSKSRHRAWISVSHEPVWVPAMLRFNAAGDTRPGFECAHMLENGMGQCGGDVFNIEDAVGKHICIKYLASPHCHRVKHSRKWKRLK